MEPPTYIQFFDRHKMGIKTVDGHIVIPAVYDFVAHPSDGLFTVTEGGYTAYFDEAGNIVVPFSNKYESYGSFTEGLARVMVHGKWGFINKAGEAVIPPQFHYTEEFANGRAIVRNEKHQHGAIDEQGNLVIDYRFPMIMNFERGYAKFGDFKTWGLIDKNGNIVVPQIYVHIGQVYRNTVTVQVLEGEEYKEGELTIGCGVVWNNNLDHLNAYNRLKKEFAAACGQLLHEMYQSGCPCAYERFRDLIQFIDRYKPAGLVDQELLFAAFKNKLLSLGNDHYKCEHCGTVYQENWIQYSAFLYVLKVTIVTPGNFIDKGAPVTTAIPVALGFYGHMPEKFNEKYVESDIATVISYLKESAAT